MKMLYQQLGISRQAHHKAVNHQNHMRLTQQALAHEVIQIRKQHPRMGLRKIYMMLKPVAVGRRRFEQMMAEKGLKLTSRKNYRRTTYSQYYRVVPNLVSSTEITKANQVWASDITYYQSSSRFYYLTFITDLYTRKIVGWAVSRTLQASANVQAMSKAIRQTKQPLNGLIHHSDRDIQYVSKAYLSLLKKHQIKISMGNKAWENAHAERINGIIKNEYLEENPDISLKELTIKVEKAVRLYNTQRPHWRLPNYMSPKAFEDVMDTTNGNYKVKINY